MQVRIYRPSKTAMQSGRANTRQWVLEFEPSARREIDRLMGWTSNSDMRQQLKLRFDSKEEAVAYCARHGLMYTVAEEHPRRVRPKAYADNFRFDRKEPWTH
jgi:hypothetical protein